MNIAVHGVVPGDVRGWVASAVQGDVPGWVASAVQGDVPGWVARTEGKGVQESFSNSVALVSGGTSGLGRALCLELGRRGATVYVTGRRLEIAREVAERIRRQGGRAFPRRMDVTSSRDVQETVDEVIATHGGLDLMVNCAGITTVGEVRDMSLEQWRELVDVNMWGVVHGTSAAYAAMAARGSGHIVNVASLGGLLPEPTSTAYVMTKFAVVGLSLSLRLEAVSLGVKVSVVCPGFVDTNIFESATVLNADRAKVFGRIPSVMRADADKAAVYILERVARNQDIILFPAYVRVFWTLWRFAPRLVEPFLERAATVFRTLKNER